MPRAHKVDDIMEYALKGKKLGKKIGLVSAAVSDYPYIDELVNKLVDNEIKFSVSSLRADSISPLLLEGLKSSGHRTITFAPEAGTEQLRRVINKNTEDDIISTVHMAADKDIPNIRMYFIIGLPFEEEGCKWDF